VNTRRRMEWVVAGAVAALCYGPAARAQSLGEVAQQEEERQASEAKSDQSGSAVITNKDLKKYDGKSALRASGDGERRKTVAVPAAGAAAGSRTRAAKDSDSDRAYWAERLDEARTTRDRAEQADKDAQDASRAVREQPDATIYDDALAQSAERKARAAEAQAARRELEQARQAYDEVERQAREAAAP